MTAQVRAVSPAEFEAGTRAQKAAIVAADKEAAAKRNAQIAAARKAATPAPRPHDEQASETPDGHDAERPRSPSTSASRRSRRARSAASRPAGPRWLTTTDHKRIGIMYMVLSFAFFMVGGVEALLMRLQLAQADNTLLDPQTYNALFTMHGTTMIFLFVVPMIAGFGNYIVPLMIGARDMAFPRLNALSFWFFVAGGAVFYGSLLFGPPECGWTCYAPLSESAYSPTGGVDAWIYLVHLTGISSLLGAVNFYVTIANMRAPGMGWGRMPLFVWAILTYSILLILALPVIAGAVTLLLTDRHFGTHFYDATNGGSPLLWQHLFWFFGHPEVYIMVLPAFGIVSEVLPVFARKPIFGYKAIAAATVGIAFLGLLVWAHHMFATPSPTYVLIAFMLGVVPDRGADRREDLQLDRDAVARHDRVQDAGPVRLRLPRDVPARRHHRASSSPTFPVDWQLHRHLLRRRAPALRADGRRGVRDLRRALLLVPEDHRAAAQRGRWASSASG